MFVLLGALPTVVFGQAHALDRGSSLDHTLTPYLERYDLPALAAAVVKDGLIIASGAVGTRPVRLRRLQLMTGFTSGLIPRP